MAETGPRPKGLYRRKLGKDPKILSKMVAEIVKRDPNDICNTATEAATDTCTTDFEPYVLSDPGSDIEQVVRNFAPTTKHYRYKKGDDMRNKSGDTMRRARARSRRTPNDRELKKEQSKKLYARIAQCGDNVAQNNIAKAQQMAKAPVAQIILKEMYLQCPFVEGHHVPGRHFKKHVRACQQKFAPQLRLKECPFNSNHLIPEIDYPEHVQRCRDQAHYLGDIANNAAAQATCLNEPMRRMQISGQVNSGAPSAVQTRRRTGR